MSFKVGSTNVLLKPTTSPDAGDSNYAGLHPSSQVLPKGHKKVPGARAFLVNTVYDRDVVIPMRDGVNLRADVFRPEGDDPVPALLVWSPYGKTGTGFLTLDLAPGRVGIGKDRLSGYEKFEGPDPAEWVARGYAIVNIDARGIFDSEGDVRWWGTAEGRDGHDAIEVIARMPWCSGKVSMVGNSWLAMSQWFIAATRPPHLTCIAPLEGASDFYRELLCRGGVPSIAFLAFISAKLYGRQEQEDVIGMLLQDPYMNEYWADKRASPTDINVPAYVLASYSTGLHTVGSFRCFEDIPHEKKWLRVHPTQEWHDLYQQDTVDDLARFFDYHMKGADNGWQHTPKVRLSMLRFNQDPLINQPLSDWPPPNTTRVTLFPSADMQLSLQAPSTEQKLTYQADAPALQVDADSEELIFSWTCPQKVYLVGSAKAVLYVSCADHTDLDVFVQLRKADVTGRILQNINIPLADMGLASEDEVVRINTNVYLGPTGVLRASRRAIDPALSRPHWPVHDHRREATLPVTAGEIVKLEIGLWPAGIVFEAGERLVLKVAGHPMTLAEFEPLRGTYQPANKGKHTLHMGGGYNSYLVVPLANF